jgi:hypothetical protein
MPSLRRSEGIRRGDELAVLVQLPHWWGRLRHSELADPGEDMLGEALTDDLEGSAGEAYQGSTQESAADRVPCREGTESRPR